MNVFTRATHHLAISLALLLGVPALAASQNSGRAPDPTQRVILITGSTSGLGREVARALAADGDHIIVHGRSVERGLALVEEINSASPGSARFYRADFASLDEVRGLAEAIRRDYDRLDVLVNNAGIFLVNDPERHLSQDGYELNFQVNYLAHYLLTDLLLPLIRESAPARIVNVASGGRPLDFDNLMLEEGYTWRRAYFQSKLAQVMHTIDLAAEIEGSGITMNALHPATFMDTNMIVGAGLQPQSSVMEGRDNVLLLINGESVGTGLFYVDGEPRRYWSAQPYDADVRAAVHQTSERLIGR